MNNSCDHNECNELATRSVNFMGFLNFYCPTHYTPAEQDRVEFLRRRALQAVRRR